MLALAPSLLTVYVGINDTWRRHDSDDATSTAEFENGYRARHATVADVPELVVIEPFLTPVTPGRRSGTKTSTPSAPRSPASPKSSGRPSFRCTAS